MIVFILVKQVYLVIMMKIKLAKDGCTQILGVIQKIPMGVLIMTHLKSILCVQFLFILRIMRSIADQLKLANGSHKKFLPTLGNYLKVFFNISKNYKFDGRYF